MAKCLKSLSAALAGIPSHRLSAIIHPELECPFGELGFDVETLERVATGKMPLEQAIHRQVVIEQKEPLSMILERLNYLGVKASLGSPQAIEQLRFIGVFVSELLFKLTNSSSHSPLVQEAADTSNSPDTKKAYQRLILDRLHEFAEIPVCSSRLTRMRAIANKSSWYCSEVETVIRKWVDADASMNKDKKSISAEITEEQLDFAILACSLRVHRRLKSEASRAAHYVASKAHQWPINAFQFINVGKEQMLDYIKKLGLGSAKGIRILPSPGRGSKNRFRSGSRTAFALEAANELDTERQLALTFPKEVIDRLKMRASERSRPTYKPIIGGWPPAGCMLQSFGKIPDPLMTQLECSMHDMPWTLPAYLLPPLSNDKDIIDKWVNAAMEWAEWLCQGDWNSYDWPRCIRMNAAYADKNGNHRTFESATREILTKGMEELCHETVLDDQLQKKKLENDRRYQPLINYESGATWLFPYDDDESDDPRQQSEV